MTRSSFSPCVCPTFHSGRGDSEAGFLIICFNPHPSFFMPGSGPSLAFGAPNLCLFTLDCLWRCVINLHGRPEVDLKGICEESVLINGKWWTGRDGVCVCVCVCGGGTLCSCLSKWHVRGEKSTRLHTPKCATEALVQLCSWGSPIHLEQKSTTSFLEKADSPPSPVQREKIS